MNDPLGLFGDEQSNDPLGLFEDSKKEGSIGTAFKRALASASTAADTAISLPAGALATYLGFQDQGDEIFRKLDERTAARTAFGNPEEELSLGQEAAAMIGTLPAQVLGMAGSPAMRGKAMLDAGETLPRAMLATQVETAVNAGGLAPMAAAPTFLGRAAIGASGNVALGAGSDAFTQSLAQTEQIKQEFDPYNPRARALEALTGGALQGTLGERPTVRPTSAKVNKILEEDRAGRPQEPVQRGPEPTNETTQLELFDQPLQGRMVSPYEATPGDWRIDENGMPVRIDLSLEAQNMQNPLQRNLWGDELDAQFPRDPAAPLGPRSTGDIPGYERFSEPVSFRNDPENQRPLTEAIDSMDPAARTAALEQTGMGREMQASGQLEAARMEAETMAWLEQAKRPETKKPRNLAKGRGRNQMGGVWFGDLGETKKLQDLAEGLPYRFPSLEKLPNKEEFTWEQLQQSINRQEVPEPERKLLTQAYDIVSSMPEVRDPNNPWKGTKANAKEFVEQLGVLASDYSLKSRRSVSYADYGLNNIGRNASREGGVTANTSLWESPYELSEGVRTHFTSPNYFGHTRNFVENGQKYVVEIQSDLVQKIKKDRSEQLKQYNNEELQGILDRSNSVRAGMDSLFEPTSEFAKEQFRDAMENTELGNLIVSRVNAGLGTDASYTVKDLVDAFGTKNWLEEYMITVAEKLDQQMNKTIAAVGRELNIRQNESTVNTMSKNWFVRLIREELADSAKKGETSVRFASADTMAKVEGWPDNHTEAQRELRNSTAQLERERAFLNSPNISGIQQEVTLNRISDLQDAIARAENALAGPRFDPQVQGIYDRYNKEVTKYLTSIGGKPMVDNMGNSWIEVPVDKSRQRPIMFGQRGVLKIDWSDLFKIDNTPLDGKTIPPTPNVAAAIEAAKRQGKDGKQWNMMQSGATSTAMKTGSPIIRAAEDIVQNAVKRADLAVRNFVFPAEKALRQLPKQELVDLGELMKAEMFEERQINPDVLARNLSEKQIRAYTEMRKLFDETLKAQNAAREAKGQKPITAREAYMASRWQGDFRQPVYDAEGNLVWYLAAHSRAGLKSQADALLKIKPGLVIDEAKAHVVKSTRSGTDLQSAYSTMLDILDPQRDKAAIQELKAAVEDQLAAESEMTLAQSKHFKKKTGVRGFAGDRPWMDRAKDITDMFQQQVQYAKNAFKWSEMQGVADDIKAIVTDEELLKTQPNNIKYIRDYTKNALGYGDAQLSRALDDAMRNAGVSPQMVSNFVGDVKSFFILQKLAVSAGYTLSNLVQAGNVMPYLADMANRGIRGNPATTLPVGFLGGMAMGVSHYIKSLGTQYMDMLPNQFFKDAFKYAEENGVTARSVYDEAPLEDRFSKLATGARLAGKTMTIPETFVRSVAFMTYAEWLRSSGKFPDQTKLFQEAERLVNKSMVDYRETERPMIFSKAGTAGNFLNTLQTYPMSFYNQWSYMLKQASRGQPAGLVTLAAFQFMVAGAMGMPFVDDAEKLYKWIRDNMVGDATWTKMMASPFFSDPKSWVIDNLGESTLYGALSDKTGIGLTSRVAAPGAGAMLQSPIGPITDIAGQIGAVGKAVMDPTDKTKLAQAAMKVAPVGLQGALETAPFMEGVTYVTRPDGTRVYQRASDLADRRGGYARTPQEETIRAMGMRSQNEVLERDVTYAARSNNQAITQRGGEIVDKYYNALRTKDYKKAMELNKLYITLTGKAISDTQLENQVTDEFLTDLEKTTNRSKTPLAITNAVRAQKIMKENR